MLKNIVKLKKKKEKEDEQLLKMIHELIEDNKEIKKEYNEKDKEIKEIKEQLENIKNIKNNIIKNIKNTNSNNNTKIKNSNLTNNLTNNITINNYGNENISFLTPKFLAKLILSKGMYTFIPNLIKEIHFNKNFPENKNLKITNKKQPYVKVYENGNWKLKDKKEAIKDIVDDKSNLFDTINTKNEVVDLFPKHYHKTRFKKYKKDFDSKDPKTIKQILKTTELEILNSCNEE